MNNTKRRVSCPQLTKLALILTLLLGWGSQAWGDEPYVNTLTFENSSIPSGWSDKSGNSNYVSYSGDYITTNNNYTLVKLTSSDKINLVSGQKIVIVAQTTQVSTGNYYGIRYQHGTDFSKFSASTGTLYDGSTNFPSANTDCTITISIESNQNEYLAFWFYGRIKIKSIDIEEPVVLDTPSMSVSPTSYDFGEVTKNEDADFTINNTGTGSFGVTITKSGTDKDLFTITEGTVSGITGENAGNFTVSFNYDGVESYGTKTATITVAPDYEGGEAQNITVTAYAKDPAIWEDFSSGIPSSWYVQGTSWRTDQSGYLDKAYVTTSSGNVLRTPRLDAKEGQTLSFDVVIGGTGSSYKIQAQYSTDRVTWTNVASAYTESGTQTFTAPATGYYWLQFTGFGSALDNFVGFGPAAATHDMALGTATTPTSGTMYGDYTASVIVKELGGSGETITAKLYFDGEEVAEKTGVSIGANRDVSVSVTFVPTSIKTAQAYLKIIYNGDVELTTTPQEVTISETDKVISEDETEVPTSLSLMSGNVLKVNYTPKNGWSTICMPFGVWNFMGDIFGTGWKLYELSSYSDGTLNFTKATSSPVSTPFLVYAENADPTKSVYYLRGVSLSTSNWTSLNINKEVEDGTSGATATFKGTFAPIAAPNMNGKYGITNESKLAKGNTSASIPGYRAYLEFSEGAPAARIITIDGDEVATDLGFVKMVDPEAKDVYTLSGQKVLKAGKGIYIVNGRKVVIK